MPSKYREAILETLRLSLADIAAGAPVEDPYPLSFGAVHRGDLPKATPQRIVAAVVAMDERLTPNSGFTEALLQVAVDFRFRASSGETPATLAETLIGVIVRRVLKDTTLNGLAVDTKQVATAIDLEAPNEITAEGSVIFQVQFRRDYADARTYLGHFAPEPEAT